MAVRSLGTSLVRRATAAAPARLPEGEKPPVPITASRRASALTMLTGKGGSDTQRQVDQFGKSTPLYSAAALNAEAVGGLTWRLFQTNSGRGRISGPDPRKEVEDHAALRLWEKPNAFMHQQFFVEYSQLLVELTGLMYIVVARQYGVPTSMWPVIRTRIVPVPDPDQYLAGYAYIKDDGSFIPLQLDEVIPIQVPDPNDPLGGMSPAKPLLTDLEAAHMTSEYRRNFFKNGANPGGIIQLDEEALLTERELQEVTERWAEQHRGVRNAHRVAILERGKWVANDVSLKNMQFTEMRQDDRNAIYEGFRTPKSIIGVTEDVNRANAEASEYVWTKWTITNKARRWRAALNWYLLPMFTSGSTGAYCFDFDNIIPEDWQADAATTASNAHAAAEMVAAGWHPDDVLASLSMPAMRYIGPPTSSPGTPQISPTEARLALPELMASMSGRAAVQAFVDQFAPSWGDL
jgi:HK97 family phage portal protein